MTSGTQPDNQCAHEFSVRRSPIERFIINALRVDDVETALTLYKKARPSLNFASRYQALTLLRCYVVFLSFISPVHGLSDILRKLDRLAEEAAAGEGRPQDSRPALS
jgi:hypothetical protein